MHAEVLSFWFEEIEPKAWWVSDPVLDEQVRARFGALLGRAAEGALSAWRQTPGGRLAEVIVLDQFSRNIHRGSPAAFAQDPLALALAKEAVAAGDHTRLASDIQRAFLLMPYMHSESRMVHEQAEALFRQFAPGNLEYELEHKAIVDRFGRYPHRNAILGRESSVEELEFLKRPGSSF